MMQGVGDNIEKGLKAAAAVLVVGSLAAGAALTGIFSSSADIEMNVHEATMEAAENGEVSADMICAETVAFQRELAETLADQERGGAENSTFVMSVQDCIAGLE